MPAQKKFDQEHKFLARIDNTPEGNQPGMWDRLAAYAKQHGLSKNDVVNQVLQTGMKVKKI